MSHVDLHIKYKSFYSFDLQIKYDFFGIKFYFSSLINTSNAINLFQDYLLTIRKDWTQCKHKHNNVHKRYINTFIVNLQLKMMQ